jgi:hypothetical protein
VGIYSFTHPEESYYVRELSIFIDEDPGNLSRWMNRAGHEKTHGALRSLKSRKL